VTKPEPPDSAPAAGTVEGLLEKGLSDIDDLAAAGIDLDESDQRLPSALPAKRDKLTFSAAASPPAEPAAKVLRREATAPSGKPSQPVSAVTSGPLVFAPAPPAAAYSPVAPVPSGPSPIVWSPQPHHFSAAAPYPGHFSAPIHSYSAFPGQHLPGPSCAPVYPASVALPPSSHAVASAQQLVSAFLSRHPERAADIFQFVAHLEAVTSAPAPASPPAPAPLQSPASPPSGEL
jgi:hypothetical protein